MKGISFKNVIRFFVVGLVIVLFIVLCDRRSHITEYGYYQGKTYVQVRPVLFSYEHKEDWFRFEDVGMDLFEVNLVVEDYHALTRTWGNEIACGMYWTYKGEGGQPFAMTVEQKSADSQIELIYVPEPDKVYQQDERVSYYVPAMTETDRMFVIEFKDEHQKIKISFLYENMDYVSAALEKVWDEFQ